MTSVLVCVGVPRGCCHLAAQGYLPTTFSKIVVVLHLGVPYLMSKFVSQHAASILIPSARNYGQSVTAMAAARPNLATEINPAQVA